MTAKLVISDHSQLGGLATGDDHTQYLLLAGRAGGQVAIGGTLTTQLLTLQDNVVDANQITFGPGISAGLLQLQTGGHDLEVHHIGVGVARPVTNTHGIIITETFTTPSAPGTIIGMGNFCTYSPAALGNNTIVAVQGNAWFDSANWGAGSTVRCLDFFPAPTVGGTSWGSANLNIYGINTAGLLNVLTRPVVADTINAISLAPIAAIFGGDNTTANIVRGIHIASAIATAGTWGRLTGLEVGPQTSGVVNHGIWLKGDGLGADLSFGAGLTVNPDARMYYDGSNLIIDPNLIGTGRVYIGVGGNDNMLLNNIEIDGDLNHDGANLGFRGVAPIAVPASYTVTNYTSDKTYDANATTINELADVLGSLILDLINQGILAGSVT